MTGIDRRGFVAGLGALAWPWAVRPAPAAASRRTVLGADARMAASPFRWTELGPDAWMVERGGGNSTVLRERGGAVVIDLKLGGIGAALEREVRARVGPVQAVIITHHHADHSEGLPAFATDRSWAHRAAAARINADQARTTEAARANPARLVDRTYESLARDFDLARNEATEPDVRRFVEWAAAARPEARAPTILVDDRTEIEFGATRLELIHPGPAHTDNDLFVVDRRRGLVITGDLLFHRHHPFIDRDAGATTAGWQRALDQILAAAPERPKVVPGHGPVTTADALRAQRRYFDVVRELVERARAQGRTRQAITAIPASEFRGWGFGDLWSENLGVLYDEGTGSR